MIHQQKQTYRESTEYNEVCNEIKQKILKGTKNCRTTKVMEVIENNKIMKVLRNKSIGKKKNYQNKKPVRDNNKRLKGTTETIKEFYSFLYASKNQNPDDRETDRNTINLNSNGLREIKQALQQIKNGRSPGKDRITCEMLKYRGGTILGALAILFNKCLVNGRILSKQKNLKVILLFKKGYRAEIEYYRLISLLSPFASHLPKYLPAALQIN
ncbi:hypothetical protein ILUMI_21835 [Ignelater luminosus]|uniref:Uncharacterized protein n=1 Tax=Ignelater luminosus TaxID=2038154 RepID=A0A8K0CBB6_IGNLU|nr:hypothetical protein ILUMI_21835 [Ignelater luminosus]